MNIGKMDIKLKRGQIHIQLPKNTIKNFIANSLKQLTSPVRTKWNSEYNLFREKKFNDVLYK